MLVDEDSDDPSSLEQGGRSLHLLLAVEGGNSTAAAITVDQIVHVRVSQSLIDTTGPARLHEFGNLGIDLPVSEVAQGGHGALAPSLLADDPILPVLLLVKSEAGTEFLLTQGRDLDGADNIGPQIQEMTQGDQGGLLGRQRIAESNTEIPFGETAVAGQNHPDKEADRLAQHEANRDGE